MSDPQYARDPSSLTAILAQFEQDGFTGQFAVHDAGMLLCLQCRQEHPAASFVMTALRRTEGASDPADMAAVVALLCPRCGTRGTVALKYGPEAGAEESEVLLALEDQREGHGVVVDRSADTLTASSDETTGRTGE
ncbi:MAG: hypothetical protein GEU74_07445 [Nitriliruptorales bacterium]|nr:hypothetical protein [Nitriliruptorales bacterium]